MRYLSTEWVDYAEKPMKYQALRLHFFSVGGTGGWGGGMVVVVGWVGVVVCEGWWCGWVVV